MGLLNSMFSTDTTEPTTESASSADETDTERKYAIVLNAGPDRVPVAGNGFNYAVELDDEDIDVQLFLDGTATKWPGEYEANPEKPFNYDWEQIQERGLLAGACGYCANAFDAADACERAGIGLLSDSDAHAPSVAELATQNYEILVVG